MNSPPAPRPGTGLPSLVALGQDRPEVFRNRLRRTRRRAHRARHHGRRGERLVPGGAARPATLCVGARRNVQGGCGLHADPGAPLSAGSKVTIGHNATLHGCTVEDLVLTGMGAIVLNGARVGPHSIIAADTVLCSA